MTRPATWALALALLVGTGGILTADKGRNPPHGDAGVATLAMAPEELEIPYEQTEIPLQDGVPMDTLHPALAAWSKTSRLNPVGGIAAHREDRRVAEARERIKRFGAEAVASARRLLANRAG